MGPGPGKDCRFNLRARTNGITALKRVKYVVLIGYFSNI